MRDLSNRVIQPQPDTSTAVALLQLQQQQNQQQMPSGNILSPSSYQGSDFQPPGGGARLESPVSMPSSHGVSGGRQDYPFTAGSNGMSNDYGSRSIPQSFSGTKRKRGDFEVRTEASLDAVSKGLINYDDAVLYFGTFFRGCVSLPIFF